MTDEPDGSAWVDATPMGAPYQHFVNKDGREKWRYLAKPDDREPPPWQIGRPPRAERSKDMVEPKMAVITGLLALPFCLWCFNDVFFGDGNPVSLLMGVLGAFLIYLGCGAAMYLWRESKKPSAPRCTS